MPRARRRGRYNWAGDGVKRDASALSGLRELATGADSESGYDSSDYGEVGATTTTPTPTTTVAPQGSSISKEQKKYDESTEYSSDMRVTMTMTLSPPSTAASVASLGDANYPTETVVVTIPLPHHSGGLSQTTEHLLIAVGSIGATIIVVTIICGIYTMRKRGITFAEAIKRMKPSKYQRQPATPSQSRSWTTPAHTWDRKEPFEYRSMKALPTTPPQVAMTRAASDSQRTLIPLLRSPSQTRSQTPEDDGPRSFLLDSLPRPTRPASHARKPSTTPSSLVLPLQTTRHSASTTRTRSLIASPEDLQYPYPAPEPQDPQPPPPTFRQFLFSRRTSSTPAPRPSPGVGFGFGGPLISRFSWTNSQAPQTPAEAGARASNANPNPGPNGVATATATTAAAALPMAAGRESVATRRSSLARFRTIDSWVSQQAARVEEQRLREMARPRGSYLSDGDGDGAGAGVGMGVEDGVPEVPDLPPNVSLLGVPGGVPGGRAAARLQRHDSSATEATVFRQHPGTEVRMSVRSLVPSEILNSKMKPSVL